MQNSNSGMRIISVRPLNFQDRLKAFEEKIGITFLNRSLLETALTHRSFCNENEGCKEHNERLELLGDAVLEMVVTEHLFHQLPEANEGTLTTARSLLVQGETLGELFSRLEIGDIIRMSRGQGKQGFQVGSKLWADIFEAIIGAIYLDQGMDVAQRFIQQTVLMELPYILAEGISQDAVSILQDICQKQYRQAPEYEVLSEEGPDHEREYVVGAYLEGACIGQGKASSKAVARKRAAQQALDRQNIWLQA